MEHLVSQSESDLRLLPRSPRRVTRRSVVLLGHLQHQAESTRPRPATLLYEYKAGAKNDEQPSTIGTDLLK